MKGKNILSIYDTRRVLGGGGGGGGGGGAGVVEGFGRTTFGT